MIFDWSTTAALASVQDVQPESPLTLAGEGLWVCLVSSGKCTASLPAAGPSPAGSALVLPPQSVSAGHLILSRAPLALAPEGGCHLLCIQLTGQAAAQFLAGLTELIGAVLGVGIASWGSRTLAPEVYLSFFSDSVSTRVEQAVAQSGGDIAAAVQGLDFLPESIRAALAAGLQTAGDQLPEKINALLEPLFLPLVQALLFVLLCMIVRWVFALLVRLLRGVNLIPLVGGANRLLGLVLGLVTGAFDCWLLALLLWFAASITTGQIDWLTTGVLQRSVGYSLFGAFNPFLLHY